MEAWCIVLPVGMTFNTSTPAPVSVGPVTATGQLIEWDLGDMAAGTSFNIDIETIIDQTTCFQGPGEIIISENEWGCGSPIINTENDPGILLAPTQLTLTHDANNSFCELCNEGEIRLLVTNTGSVLLTDVSVFEDLRASGLTYVPNSTAYLVDGVPSPSPLAEPIVSGAVGEVINWTPAQIPELANLYSAFSVGPGTPQEIEWAIDREGRRVDENEVVPLPLRFPPPEILKRIEFSEPCPPRRLISAIPVDLETIVLKAIDKSPHQRYMTADELAERLGTINYEIVTRISQRVPREVAGTG